MMSSLEIKRKLKRAGYTELQINGVICDIGLIICAKALGLYLQSLPENMRKHILALSPEEQLTYFGNNYAKLPKLDQAQFDAVHDQTWHDYFASLA